MAVILPPDFAAPVVQYLKAAMPGEAAALTPPITLDPARIKMNLSNVTPGGFAVSVTPMGGFPAEPGGQARPRCDLRFYGSSGYEAMRLYRLGRALLEPVAGPYSFSAGGVRIDDLAFESSQATPAVEENGWHYAFISVLLLASLVQGQS